MLNKILMAVVIVLLFVSIVPGLLLEHDHEIVETKIISLPTCETSGVKRQVCSCGLYVDSKINPLDHDFHNGQSRNKQRVLLLVSRPVLVLVAERKQPIQ